MGRKQRKFAGIARLMGHGPRRGRSIVMGRGMYLNDRGGGGGGVYHLNGRTYDLNQPIGESSFPSPERDVPAYLEAMRSELRAATATGGENVRKAIEDVEELVRGHQQTLADYRNHLRTVPDYHDGEGRADLRQVKLRFDPKEEMESRGERDSAAARSYLGQMSRAQYNITCAPVAALGLDDERSVRKLERFRALHDCLSLSIAYLSKRDPQMFMRGGWESLPQAAEYKRLAGELGQAVRLVGPALNETNAEEGKNWVPGPILSARILPLIAEELSLIGFFETVTMPGPQYDMGVQGSHIKSRKVNENILDDGSSSGATIVADYFKTKKFSFVAKKHACAAVASSEWVLDAVVQSQFILSDLAYAIRRGQEDWMLNGQLTSALDGVSIASDDIRKMGDGLRYWYKQMKDAGIIADVDFSAGITAEGLVKMFGQQRAYGSSPRRGLFICNAATYAQLLVLKTQPGGNVLLTEAELGPRATVRTGSLGQLFGRNLVVVNDLADTMDATGIIPAVASDRSVLLHVMTDAVKVGERLGVEVRYGDQVRFLEYQDVFRAVARHDIQNGYPAATEPFVSQGVGIRRV